MQSSIRSPFQSRIVCYSRWGACIAKNRRLVCFVCDKSFVSDVVQRTGEAYFFEWKCITKSICFYSFQAFIQFYFFQIIIIIERMISNSTNTTRYYNSSRILKTIECMSIYLCHSICHTIIGNCRWYDYLSLIQPFCESHL